MVGLDVPVIPVEHQYIVTEAHQRLLARHKAGLPEMGVLRESDSAWYMREENGGFILGPYERGAPCCYMDGPSPESEYELFQEDIDRLGPHIEAAIARVPAFGEVGIKKIYNGAIAYTPDGNPIVGPAPGLVNFWLNEGHSFGVTASGGAGWQLAEWIVEGEPSIDMMGVDPRRFGPYASEGYLKIKNEEAYANVFTIHYPDEERPAARPLKVAPCYDRLKALGAVFGSVYGWERPNWFAAMDYKVTSEELGIGAHVLTNENHAPPLPDGRIVERWSFRRSNYFNHVGEEVRAVSRGVGLLDMTPFAKCWISGPGAEAWLDSILANRIQRTVGRVSLCHLLTERGGVRAEFTVYRQLNGFYLVSAGALEAHDHDVLRKLMPGDGSVRLDSLTTQWGVLVIAGPKSRDVLQKLTRTSLDNANFPWLSGRKISIAAASAHALRVNFVGELGWELHHPIEQQNYIFDSLMQAGEECGIRPFGIRAMMSRALEKSYRLVGREMSIEYCAFESGLDRFVDANKGPFLGRDALLQGRERGFKNRLVTMEVLSANDVDARGSEPIVHDGELVGRATSGGFGWRVQKSLALGMVRPDLGEVGQKLKIKILGRLHDAIVVRESPYDPHNARLRS